MLDGNVIDTELFSPATAGTPQRRARSTVAVVDGRLAAWLDPSGKRIATFGGDTTTIVEATWDLANVHSRATISQVDGIAAHDHPIAVHLQNRGFARGYKGFTLPVQHSSTRP